MAKRLSFEVKEQMVTLAGACFWFWNSFYSFLDSCGVPRPLQQRYPRDSHNKYQVMRNILGDLEDMGRDDVIKGIVSNFYRMRGPADRDSLDITRARRLLDEFREAVGNDPIETALQEQEAEKARAAFRDSLKESTLVRQRLTDLNARFLILAGGREHTPQQRGFALESLLFDLLQHSEIDHTKPFRSPTGEQIDGHFKFEKFDYLVEAKWLAGPVKQEHIAVFDVKIRGRAQSTRGMFLGAEGFDDQAVRKFSGDEPRIVLMTGEDLAYVLNGTLPFQDVLKAKIDAMVRHGRIDLPVREMI